MRFSIKYYSNPFKAKRYSCYGRKHKQVGYSQTPHQIKIR